MRKSTEIVDRKIHGIPTKSNKSIGRQAQSAFDYIVEKYDLDKNHPDIALEKRITVREEILHHMAYNGHASSWVETIVSENENLITTISTQKKSLSANFRTIKSALLPLWDKRFPHEPSKKDKKSLRKVFKRS